MSGNTKLETIELKLSPREAFTVIQFVEGWMLDQNNKPTSKHIYYLNEISTRLNRLDIEEKMEQIEEDMTMALQEYNNTLSNNKVTLEEFRNRPLKRSVKEAKYMLVDTVESRESVDMPKVLRAHIKACVIKTILNSSVGRETIQRVMQELNVPMKLT